MKFNIRWANKYDMKAVLGLIKELAVFEKEPEAVEVTEEDLIKDGFGTNPKFKLFVAEINNEIVGIALFYERYSTWKGPTIHLEDLIVTYEKRGLNIGFQLYKKVMEYAFNVGVRRVEWNVLDWNTPAIEFYEKTGAKVLREWDTAQITRDNIAAFLNKKV
ncbi:MAG: N-acetyltransferase family protein [Lutibacter sp.]